MWSSLQVAGLAMLDCHKKCFDIDPFELLVSEQADSTDFALVLVLSPLQAAKVVFAGTHGSVCGLDAGRP